MCFGMPLESSGRAWASVHGRQRCGTLTVLACAFPLGMGGVERHSHALVGGVPGDGKELGSERYPATSTKPHLLAGG